MVCGGVEAYVAFEGVLDGFDIALPFEDGGDVRAANDGVGGEGLDLFERDVDAEFVEFGDDLGIAIVAGGLENIDDFEELGVIVFDVVTEDVHGSGGRFIVVIGFCAREGWADGDFDAGDEVEIDGVSSIAAGGDTGGGVVVGEGDGVEIF